MYDIVIVGGGPAGFTAALYAARAKLDILLIEKMISGGQMATTYLMENFPGFEEPISGPDLALRMENQARRFGAHIINDAVTELVLDKQIKVIKTPENTFRSKAIILSMGARPRELGLPNEKKLRGSGVSYCATCDGAFFKDRVVAVVGGGDTAAEDAIYLTRFCPKVYLIHRRDSLRATKILQEAIFDNKKIEIIWDSAVEEIKGGFGVEGIKVRNLKTNETQELSVEGMFVAIGVLPNTGLVKGKVELNQAGYVIADDNMLTNIFGVYAAGDIREKVLRQVITAASDGAVAAYMAERYIYENKW